MDIAAHRAEIEAGTGADAETLARVSALQQIFAGHLPAAVLAEVAEIPQMQFAGLALIRRLDALRVRHRLTVPDDEDAPGPPPAAEIVRIIGSGGLVDR